MTKKLPTSCVLALAVCGQLLPCLASAQTLVVFPAEATGVAQGDAAAIAPLFVQAYQARTKQKVIAPQKAASQLAEGRTHAEATRALGAEQYARLSAVGAGARISLDVQLYAASGERVRYGKTLAANADDLPAAVDRIVTEVTGSSVSQVVPPAPAVQALPEVAPPTPVPSRGKSSSFMETLTGVRVGFHQPLSRGINDEAAISVMFDMRLDAERYFLEFGAGALLPATVNDSFYDDGADGKLRVGGIVAEVGGNYYLSRGNWAPYLGGGVRPGILLTGGGEELAMFAPFATLGLSGPRDLSTRFFADFRAAQHVLAISAERADGSMSKEHYPTELSLQLGVGW